ncbi:MAG: HIT family protein [Magnetococcus sp. DMHC-6]
MQSPKILTLLFVQALVNHPHLNVMVPLFLIAIKPVTMKQTKLHPLLAKDCLTVLSLSLCDVFLMNDCQYPWLILVPDRPGLRDLDELTAEETPLVYTEIQQACRVLRRLFNPTKLNVAALGNIVPQLHIHVIARFTTDPAWPKPIWGYHPPIIYPSDQLEDLLTRLRDSFGCHLSSTESHYEKFTARNH